jgi:hypothetical protein
VSRRDPGIRLSLTDIGKTAPDDIRYLAPKLPLFYKAKKSRRTEIDFATVLPCLTRMRRLWPMRSCVP